MQFIVQFEKNEDINNVLNISNAKGSPIRKSET